MKRQTENKRTAEGQLYIIGAGMGDPRTLTVEAREAVGRAAFVIGAERMLAPYQNDRRCIAAGRTDDILQALARVCGEPAAARTVVVLMSGDSGFFSGTKQLLAALGVSHGGSCEPCPGVEYAVTVLPGVSSLSYFCARIGRSWEDVKIVNLHGANENLWQAALTHEKVFAVTGGDVREQLAGLAEHGMGDVCGYVGERLSYEDERIRQGTVAQLCAHAYDNPAVLYLENPRTVGHHLTGLPDDSFARGKTPMTKAEVRAVVMSKLRVREGEIVYDIGAGTGSVSVELSLAASKGMVFSVEKDADAIELCKLNKERFSLHNMKIIEGEAPDVLRGLPAPDAAFIGGSGGRLEEIVACLREKNPSVRLVVNTVTVESTERALRLLEDGSFAHAEAVQIQVNRIKKAGKSHMVAAQNPVTIVTATGRGDRGSGIGEASGGGLGVLIAGNGSGSGKTTLVCGILAALRRKGLRPRGFKCGPDYIDPSYHRAASGVPCYNLDPFFTEGDVLRQLYERHMRSCDIGVVEGVMGYYDGVGFTEESGTYTVAKELGLPVILTVDCKGMGSSVMASVEGFLRHRQPSYIYGVIFNRIAPPLYEQAARAARALGVVPLGYLPESEELRLDSRHLGLVMAQELEDFAALAERMGEAAARTVDLDGIVRLAQTAVSPSRPLLVQIDKITHETENDGERPGCRIAVARDEAFCFLYEDNLNFLRERGAQILPFSPLHDSALPECDALYLSGGYPELYAAQLEENVSMREEIREKIESGLPAIAECGGFLYLHDRIQAGDEGPEGEKTFYSMAGVIGADAVGERRRGRFGYIEATLAKDCLLGRGGDTFRAHEFHYWTSLADCADLEIYRPGNGSSWREGFCTDTLYAGFPHLYFYGSPKVGESFLRAAGEYAAGHERKEDGNDGNSAGERTEHR